ncbi:MAG: phage holin family protein [Anaerolineaceae bacterium]|nr:phage holin family protein [Anaerolineaceae bacterium]
MHFVAQDEGDKLNKDLGMQGFVRLDTVTPVGLQAFCRTAIVLFFCGNEGLSIVENLGIMGLPLPGFVKTKFEQLKAKGNPDENSPEE